MPADSTSGRVPGDRVYETSHRRVPPQERHRRWDRWTWQVTCYATRPGNTPVYLWSLGGHTITKLGALLEIGAIVNDEHQHHGALHA